MAEQRKQLYKGREQRNPDERRHARADEGVQLRKDKREDQVGRCVLGREVPTVARAVLSGIHMCRDVLCT